MTGMAGLDEGKAAAWISKRVDGKRHRELFPYLDTLLPDMLRLQLAYLHACGALDEAGDTGEGDYDEDDALEYILSGIAQADGDARELLLSALIGDFLTLFDQFLLSEGLLCV